jgi:hypothetical protein
VSLAPLDVDLNFSADVSIELYAGIADTIRGSVAGDGTAERLREGVAT